MEPRMNTDEHFSTPRPPLLHRPAPRRSVSPPTPTIPPAPAVLLEVCPGTIAML